MNVVFFPSHQFAIRYSKLYEQNLRPLIHTNQMQLSFYFPEMENYFNLQQAIPKTG